MRLITKLLYKSLHAYYTSITEAFVSIGALMREVKNSRIRGLHPSSCGIKARLQTLRIAVCDCGVLNGAKLKYTARVCLLDKTRSPASTPSILESGNRRRRRKRCILLRHFSSRIVFPLLHRFAVYCTLLSYVFCTVSHSSSCSSFFVFARD